MARDLAAMNQDASRLREQAKALHEAGDANRIQVLTDSNNKLQAARRDESSHQAAADRADSQVVSEQRALAASEKALADVKAQAAKATDPVKAEELREDIGHAQAEVDSVKATIAATQQAGAEARAGVEAAKAEQARVLEDRETIGKPAVAIEDAADQLDQKARYLEDAAKLERQATVAEMDGDKVTAQEQRQLADDALMRANKIQPEVSKIDPQVLQQSGIDPATVNTQQEYTKDDTDSTGIDDPAPAATDGNGAAAATATDANAAAATTDPTTATDANAADALDADAMDASAAPTSVDLLGTDTQPSDTQVDAGDLTAPTATDDQGSDLDTGTVDTPDIDTPPTDVNYETPPDDAPAEPDVDTTPSYDSDDSGSMSSDPEPEPEPASDPEPDMVDGG